MEKVYVIKFQEVEEKYGMSRGGQYKTLFVPVEDHYYLKYFRCVDGSKFLSVSDDYAPDISNPVCFTFNKNVTVVGYSTDVPLIISANGKNGAVLMPNYTGTVEMLPVNSLPSFYSYEGRMGSLLAIPKDTIISIKPGV